MKEKLSILETIHMNFIIVMILIMYSLEREACFLVFVIKLEYSSNMYTLALKCCKRNLQHKRSKALK